MSIQDTVGVAILTWNSEACILACLDSLQGQPITEIVVVDNASTDKTIDLVQSYPLPIKLICEPTNTGFAAASNRALEALNTRFKLCLNDDARLSPNYLSILVEALNANPDAASAIGKLVHEFGAQRTIDSAGIEMVYPTLSPLDRGYKELDQAQFDRDEEIFGPSAAAALYRSEALSALEDSPFDVDLFAYYEDVDLAWRLTNQGWRHLYRPKAIAYHDRRGPDSKPEHIKARAFANRYVVWAKNQPVSQFLFYSPVALPWEIARILRRLLRDPASLEAVPQGLGKALKIVLRRVLNTRLS